MTRDGRRARSVALPSGCVDAVVTTRPRSRGIFDVVVYDDRESKARSSRPASAGCGVPADVAGATIYCGRFRIPRR